MSYETYALVQDRVKARPLAPITLKGISREVVPYAVEALQDDALTEDSDHLEAISNRLQLSLNLAHLGADEATDIEAKLQNALERVRERRRT